MREITEIRVDFSLKREVFFVVIGAIVGAVTFVIPKAIFEVEMGLPYYLTWIAFGHILGVYSSGSVIAGIAIHMLTAISIGVVVGIFLYKTGILNISKISNGLLYGLFTGSVVFVVFFIPVYQFVLAPEIAYTMKKMIPHMTQAQAAQQIAGNFKTIMISSVITHLVFGVPLGLISYFLSVRFGSRYRCSKCDISFSRIDSYQKHVELVHGAKPIQQKHILILGGGFAGLKVLMQLQKAFQNDVSVDIMLVSRDNFFLFTPMLSEVSSGMIETRNIVTPVRAFCNRAKFYEANRQGKIAANNIFSKIIEESEHHHKKKKVFDYKTKGVMALIGRRNGVGILLGHRVQGFTAWFFWRFYYLSTLPTVQKKLRVMTDWFIDLFFKRDVTRLKTPLEEKSARSINFEAKKKREDSVNGAKIVTD
jgi:hypothetical protein